MPAVWPRKDSADVLDYTVSFAAFLDDDTITSHEVTRSGDDTALQIDSSTHGDHLVVVWLSGGTDGVVYTITIKVVTVGGRTIERDVRLPVNNL